MICFGQFLIENELDHLQNNSFTLIIIFSEKNIKFWEKFLYTVFHNILDFMFEIW